MGFVLLNLSFMVGRGEGNSYVLSVAQVRSTLHSIFFLRCSVTRSLAFASGYVGFVWKYVLADVPVAG